MAPNNSIAIMTRVVMTGRLIKRSATPIDLVPGCHPGYFTYDRTSVAALSLIARLNADVANSPTLSIALGQYCDVHGITRFSDAPHEQGTRGEPLPHRSRSPCHGHSRMRPEGLVTFSTRVTIRVLSHCDRRGISLQRRQAGCRP